MRIAISILVLICFALCVVGQSSFTRTTAFKGAAAIRPVGGGTINYWTNTISPSSADTFTIAFVPDANNGTATSIELRSPGAFERVGLLQFDLSGIPVGAIISNVTLRLVTSPLQNDVYRFYRILSANSSWTELYATWNYANTNTSTRWAGDTGNDGGTDAGCTITNTDFSSTIAASVTFAVAGGQTNLITVDNAEFGLMMTNNYGFAIKNGGSSGYIYTKEHSDSSYRPSITVVYGTNAP